MQEIQCVSLKRFLFLIVISSILFLLLNNLIILDSLGEQGVQGSESDSESRGSRAIDFDVEFASSELVIDPNTQGSVNFNLDNKGDGEDTYDLSFSQVPSSWDAKFLTDLGKLEDELSITVGTVGYKPIPIYLSAPDSGSGTLIVACKSKGDPNLQKTAEIYLEAKYIIRVFLLDSSNLHRVSAGKNTSFTLEVKNYQDNPDEVSISVEQNPNLKIQNTPDEVYWSVAFTQASLALDVQEAQNVTLTIFAPISGEAEDKIKIFLTAKSSSSEQTFKSPELNVEIPKVFNITYTLLQDSKLTLPNSTVNYTLKLFNVGNVDSEITLTKTKEYSTNPEDVREWIVLFNLGENLTTPEDINLNVNDFVTFQVQVKIPVEAKAGAHTIVYGIYVTGKGSTPINEIEITTHVTSVSGVNLDLGAGFSSLISLGKTSERQIVIENTGNGKETLNVFIYSLSIPTDWTIYFKSVKNTKEEANITESVDFTKPFEIVNIENVEYIPTVESYYQELGLILLSGQEAFITLSISTPSTGKSVIETFTIFGESESGTIATTKKDISMTVRVSDLFIGKIILDPKKPVRNEKVKIKFNVTNNFHLPANNIFAKIYKIDENDKTELYSNKISSLGASESTTVEYTWSASEEVTLQAELFGDIIPTNNTPYQTAYVFVEEPTEPKEEKNNFIVIALVIAIIVAFIIFLTIWLVFQKRAREHVRDERISSPEERHERFKAKRKSLGKVQKTKKTSMDQRRKK